jgi:hypothetical protein
MGGSSSGQKVPAIIFMKRMGKLIPCLFMGQKKLVRVCKEKLKKRCSYK